MNMTRVLIRRGNLDAETDTRRGKRVQRHRKNTT